MKTTERNSVGNIAQMLIRSHPKADLNNCLRNILAQQDALMPDLSQFVHQWTNQLDQNDIDPSGTAIWQDFKSMIEQNPLWGFVVIEGREIRDITSFYAEINRVYMAGENWTIGSLDGFDDLLYGGFGALKDAKNHSIIWKDKTASQQALGVETTIAYYQSKLTANSPFNHTHFQHKLEDLQAGKGQTYFDIVTEIIQSHPKIEWIY